MRRLKKKGAPLGTPINSQQHGTTPEGKSHAEVLFDKIGTGRAKALKRPTDTVIDRELRRIISKANMNGDCIINLGDGYFRPNEEDRAQLEHYLKAEMHRAKEIMNKAAAMSTAYNRRYK